MQYCSNCGSVLNEGSKFCSGCGNQVTGLAGEGKKSSKEKTDKPLMEKGVVKSLKKGATNHIKSKIQKPISHKPEISKRTKIPKNNQKPFQNKSTNEIGKKSNSAKILMIYYLFLNIPLYFINTSDDEIIGILFFSAIIMLLFLIRMNKEKPINLILKIILGLQIVLMTASLMINLQKGFSSLTSIIAVITLAFLIYVSGKILLKGNKTN